MGRKGSIKVTRETDTGRNTHFRNPKAGQEMTRGEFVKGIEQGKFPNHHVRVINGKKTPVSNPDGSEGNNLE